MLVAVTLSKRPENIAKPAGAYVCDRRDPVYPRAYNITTLCVDQDKERLICLGMTDAQAVRCRKRLEQFLVDLLEPVGRSERRHWGEVYVRSLLLDGERKSIEPLATRLPEGNVQAMQQFIGQSPWEWNLVWERLGKRMTAELEPDPAWVVDDTGFPKQGRHSVAVERQYSGTLGKTGNCQIAVSVHHVGEQGNVPLGWRLYLPESWANDAQRRREAGIPEGIVFRRKWELALEIIDQIREWGLPDRVVLGDAGYGDGTEFREELEKRKLKYAVGVLPQVGVWLKPPKITPLKTTGRGRPPTAARYGHQRPTTAQEAARQARAPASGEAGSNKRVPSTVRADRSRGRVCFQ